MRSNYCGDSRRWRIHAKAARENTQILARGRWRARTSIAHRSSLLKSAAAVAPPAGGGGGGGGGTPPAPVCLSVCLLVSDVCTYVRTDVCLCLPIDRIRIVAAPLALPEDCPQPGGGLPGALGLASGGLTPHMSVAVLSIRKSRPDSRALNFRDLEVETRHGSGI